MEQIDQQNAFRENRRVLQHFGWRCSIDGTGHTWFCSEETNQWSREFPLFALLSSDLKQEVHRLFTQPAPRPSPSRHRPPPPPPIGPSSSHSSHEAPLIQIHQYSGACVTSSPPPLMIVPMMMVIVPLAAAFQSLQDTSSADRRRPSTVGVWWWCWYFWCLRAETVSGIGGGGVGIGGVGNGRVGSIRSGRIWL